MKKWAFIICCILSLGFVLMGCGNDAVTISANDVLYYNGPSAAIVGDYLYFGNGMNENYTTADSLGTTSSNYNAAKGLAYLAKLNVNAEKLSSKGIDYSPKGVSKIGDEVATYTNASGINSFTFVIGNYVFYAAPNNWETSGGQFNFGWTSIYRSRFDGSNKKEIYSTRDLKAAVTKIEVLKYNGKYYLMMLAGTNLVKLNLENGGTQVLKDVTSVAMPKTYQSTRLGSTTDWNGILYFTKSSENDNVYYNDVYSISMADLSKKPTKIEALTGAGKGGAVTFIDREVGYVRSELVDEVFFTRDGSTYKMTRRTEQKLEDGQMKEKVFYDTPEFVSNNALSGAKIYRVVGEETVGGATQFISKGYIYTTGSEVHYVENSSADKTINFVNENNESISFSQVVSVDGTWVVLLGGNNVYRAEISKFINGTAESVDAKTVVSMETGIFTEQLMASYDRNYVYYYAKLNPIEAEDADGETSDDKTGNDDTNYYFCRSSLDESQYFDEATQAENYQFLGVTQTGYRHS